MLQQENPPTHGNQFSVIYPVLRLQNLILHRKNGHYCFKTITGKMKIDFHAPNPSLLFSLFSLLSSLFPPPYPLPPHPSLLFSLFTFLSSLFPNP
jgi:hypothetical protein